MLGDPPGEAEAKEMGEKERRRGECAPWPLEMGTKLECNGSYRCKILSMLLYAITEAEMK